MDFSVVVYFHDPNFKSTIQLFYCLLKYNKTKYTVLFSREISISQINKKDQ